jgi:hypothetical protein
MVGLVSAKEARSVNLTGRSWSKIRGVGLWPLIVVLQNLLEKNRLLGVAPVQPAYLQPKMSLGGRWPEDGKHN